MHLLNAVLIIYKLVVQYTKVDIFIEIWMFDQNDTCTKRVMSGGVGSILREICIFKHMYHFTSPSSQVYTRLWSVILWPGIGDQTIHSKQLEIMAGFYFNDFRMNPVDGYINGALG